VITITKQITISLDDLRRELSRNTSEVNKTIKDERRNTDDKIDNLEKNIMIYIENSMLKLENSVKTRLDNNIGIYCKKGDLFKSLSVYEKEPIVFPRSKDKAYGNDPAFK
jgi:hypothetical protein